MRFLLDEHLSPKLARELREMGLDAVALQTWQDGAYLQQPDETLLQAARDDNRILVTYDVHTIPRLLKEWAERGQPHAGIILISSSAIPPNDYGRLIGALHALAHRDTHLTWENRVMFLTRE